MRTKTTSLKNIRIITLALLFSIPAIQAKAQTQQFTFTQFMNNLTPVNPAYSLLDDAGAINSATRQQWLGVDGAPKSYELNGNLPLESINSKAGLMVLYDKFAIEHQTEANAFFAKSIQVGTKNFIGVSINAGVRNYVANYSQLDGDGDPVFRNDIKSTKPNVGFGVIYYSDWFYLGLSVPELTIRRLGVASAQDPIDFRNTYYFSGALLTELGDDFQLKTAGLASYSKGIPVIADVSLTLYTKRIVGIGIDYRTNKEMAGILTLNINPFQIGYSYQSGTSPENLGNFNAATHEIFLGYRFGKAAEKPKIL